MLKVLFTVLPTTVMLAGPLLFSASANAQNLSVVERRRDLYQTRRQEILLNLRHEISALSTYCHENGMGQAALDLTALSLDLTQPTADYQPPRLVQLPLSQRVAEDENHWRRQLKRLREDRAKELYILARQALRADLPSLAYSIIGDVLRLDPDHSHSRSVRGEQLFFDRLREDDPAYAGEWVSPFEARRRSGSNPETNHPVYGWIPVSHVARYDEGLRPWRGNWVSVQKEAALRQDFRNAWEISSEHFLVKTNTSLEEGVVISRKLETFHAWLKSNFAAFFDTPQALEERFELAQTRRRSTRSANPMEIHYYATRDEYNRRLKGKIPPDRVTNGLYWEPDRTCYFFRNPEDPDHRTVFHEATHQILDLATLDDRLAASRKRRLVLRQPRPVPWRLCENSNFWIIEGLASYFESFEVHDGRASVGRPDYIRFVGARQRYLQDNFYVPLQIFCSLGHDDFMGHPNFAQFYTQSSGVAHFLLHYENGMYRDDLVRLLSAVYRPDLRDVTKEPSLEEICGVKFATLDQQYREHLENLP
ncbi:MAG: hypothetical protein RIK87_16750 [Fuerstiella sp.]